MNFRAFLVPVVAAFAMAGASANAAITLDNADVGNSFTVEYTGQAGGASTTQLDSSQEFTLDSIVNGVFSFSYTLSNETAVASRIRSFGFNVEDLITGSANAADTYATARFGDLFPESLGNRSICFRASGGNNCTGGPNGITQGQSATGSFALDLGIGATSITLSDFALRYQSVNPAVNGETSAVGIGTVTTPVPEPGTWAMLILGFGLVGAAMRRRRRDAATQEYAHA